MQEPQILYEEPTFAVINKPAGMLVHNPGFMIHDSGFRIPSSAPQCGASAGKHDSGMTVVDWLLKKYPEAAIVGDNPATRPGIVHRLDKETSGVMIIPRTQDAFNYFKNLFQTHQIKKTYLALVYGVPKEPSGVINKPLGLKPGSVKRTAFTKNAKMVKEAITQYRVKKTFQIYWGETPIDCSLLEVKPLTGRTHQIRVHLASIGCPVVGDGMYGKKHQSFDTPHQLLHADSLEFVSPRGSRLKISADIPKYFALYIT